MFSSHTYGRGCECNMYEQNFHLIHIYHRLLWFILSIHYLRRHSEWFSLLCICVIIILRRNKRKTLHTHLIFMHGYVNDKRMHEMLGSLNTVQSMHGSLCLFTFYAGFHMRSCVCVIKKLIHCRLSKLCIEDFLLPTQPPSAYELTCITLVS